MASVVNWTSSAYFRYYNSGWSSWSTAPTYGAYCNNFKSSTSGNYKVQGGCTVTPASGKYVSQFSVTTKILNGSESATSCTWYCYLTTNNEGWLTAAPTSYTAMASVTATPSASGVSIKFTFTGLKIFSATNFYMTFATNTDKYYMLGYGGFAYSAADMTDTYPQVNFRPNGGSCTYAGTTYTASENMINVSNGSTYTIGAPSYSGYQFLGWSTYGSTPGTLSKSWHKDTGFTSGYNDIGTYNNSGGSTHTWNRVSDSNDPRSWYSGYHLSCSIANATTSPGSGGFVQSTSPGASKTIVASFRLKFPSGNIQFAHNSMGTGYSEWWLTRRTAADAYVNYGYYIKTGTGTISTMGHVYFDRAKPFSFYLGYASVWNISDGWSMTHGLASGQTYGAVLGVWAPNNYTVSYNANGGSSTPSSQTKYHDQGITLAAAIARANSGDSNSYTVAFNANGGSSTPSTITSKKYTSYTFKNWNTASGGTGTAYNASASYTANASATMYAQWNSTNNQRAVTLPAAIARANGSASRTVTLDANGGSVSPTSKTSTATVTYAFEKWHLNSASGTAYAAGASYTPTANCTMYAGWTSSTGTYSAVTLPTPTRTGYTCSGWYTSGGTKRANAGGSYTPSASETLYAHWTVNTYTISYSLGGGSFPHASNTTYTSGNYTYVRQPTSLAYDMSNITPIDSSHPVNPYFVIEAATRTGYTLTKWTISGMDTTTHYSWWNSQGNSFATATYDTSTQTTNVTSPILQKLRATAGTVTVTAVWSANTYDVRYSVNGGIWNSNDSRPGTAVSGQTYVLLTYDSSIIKLNTPTRVGYTFTGWAIANANTSTAQYRTSASGSWAAASNTTYNYSYLELKNLKPSTSGSSVTITAQWTANSVVFKLAPNGGTLAPQAGGTASSTTKDYSYTYGTWNTLPSPVKTGYTFRCWARNMDITECINYGRDYMWTDYFQCTFWAYQSDWSTLTTYFPGGNTWDVMVSCTESGGWAIGQNNGKIWCEFYDTTDAAYKNFVSTTNFTSLSAGWHRFGILYKDKKITLYVDDTAIGSSATGTGGIKYHASNSIFVTAEAQGTATGYDTTHGYKGFISPIYLTHQNTFHTGLIAGATCYASGPWTWTAQYYGASGQQFKLDPNGGTVVPQAGGAASSSTQTYTYNYATNQTLPTPTRTGYDFITWAHQMSGSEIINYGRAYMGTTSAFRYRIRAYMDNWSTLGTNTILSCTESGGWSLGNNSGNIQWWCYSKQDAAYKNATSTTTWASLSAGWHCFEMTFDGTNAKGYLDGNLIATSAAFTAIDGDTKGRIGYAAENDIMVGDEATGIRAGHSGSQYFTGKVGPFYQSNSSTPVGTGSVNAASVYAGSVTWTAEWRPHTYTVTFKTGNTTMGTQSFTYGTAQNLTAVANLSNAPVSGNGWSFYGWATEVNTNTRTYTNGQSVNNLTATDGGNVTLYAIYSRSISGKYYDSATATTTINISGITQYYKNTSTTAAAASSVTFPTLYTQTSYNWAPKAWSNGTGTTQTIAAATSGTAASGTPSVSSSATYNALYSRTVTVAYNGNNNTGGSTTSTTGTQWYNAGNTAATALSLTLAANGFTRTGYTFSKWATAPSGGTLYNASSSYPWPNTAWNSSTSTTVYAQWTVNTYTVKFQTGNTQMGTQSFTYTESKALTAEADLSNKPVTVGSVGWTFAGWGTGSNLSTVVYTDGQTVTKLTATNNATVTLYAIYSRAVTGKYYNGATATSASNISLTQYYRNTSTTAASGSSVNLPALNTQTTYSWAPYGWVKNSTTSITAAPSITITEGQATAVTPTLTEATAYYALYQRTVAIIYNGNTNTGGSTANTGGTQKFNAGNTQAAALSLTLANNGFTKAGYAFVNWANEAAGTTQYAEGSSYTWPNTAWTSTVSKTLYAIWEPKGIIRVPSNLIPSGITTNANNSVTAGGTTYLLTIPFVYIDGEWVQCMPFGHNGTDWKVGE